MQVDTSVRYGVEVNMTSQMSTNADYCNTMHAMDQAFLNYLLYTDQLSRWMATKIFQQGEGPVNTIGALSGSKAVLKFSLKEWKILKGAEPGKLQIMNWNGDPSPVVHQADRFLGPNGELSPSLESHLQIFSML